MRTASKTLILALLCSPLACGGGDSEEASGSAYEGGDNGDDGSTLMCGEEWAEKDPNSGVAPMQPFMGFGAPCQSDADCSEIAGGAGTCVTDILGLFEAPGGICTVLECDVPSDQLYVVDAPDCSPDGGVNCVGIAGTFTACLPPCTSNDECNREGYGCRLMPIIGETGAPTYCLMDAQACCLADNPSQCGGAAQ